MTLKYGDVSFVLIKLSVLSLTGRVCILGFFFVLNSRRVSAIPKHWSSNPVPLPRGMPSSRLVVLSSSWDRLVDNLVFSDSPALQKTQREPISNVLVFKRNMPYVTQLGSRGRTDSHAGEKTIK